MFLIDSHAHLYLEEFKEDRQEVIARAKQNEVKKIFLPNIDSTSIGDLLRTEEEFPGMAYAMMGLHPCSVKEDAEEELALVRSWLDKRSFAAVGEIGLDFYWEVTFKAQQIHAFTQQIRWAQELNLPIVIHSRNSTRECIDLVRAQQDGKLAGVFHCFSGTAGEAKEIIDLGFYLGIGGVVTFKKSALPEIIREIDLGHLLLETDAPYLAPVPFRGKRNESSYIRQVAQKIADIKEISLEEVAETTTQNALRLFRI